jgi:hypothetical protein
MTVYNGHLKKMQVSLQQEPSPIAGDSNYANVNYELVLDDQLIALNSCIGSHVEFIFNNKIACIHCGRSTNKSFSQGYCYPCFKSLARCDLCIVSPEKCHYHLGTCREPEWAQNFCMQDHYVYLANSSGVKVGITRGTQIPTRWIDQGAIQALPIYRVTTRLQAGLVETAFKSHVADKTNWRSLLKGEPERLDLAALAVDLKARVAADIMALQNEHGLQSISDCEAAEPVDIQFPVLEYPQKIVSHNFDKEPTVAGTLWGIKGQYLLLDTGVINMRKFGGYQISASLSN